MAIDVKNNAGGDTGDAQNSRLTVKGNRNNNQFRDPEVDQDYTIAKFDQAAATGSPTDGTNLSERFDDPTYYG